MNSPEPVVPARARPKSWGMHTLLVMLILRREPALSAAYIADKLGITRNSAYVLLRRMRDAGLVVPDGMGRSDSGPGPVLWSASPDRCDPLWLRDMCFRYMIPLLESGRAHLIPEEYRRHVE